MFVQDGEANPESGLAEFMPQDRDLQVTQPFIQRLLGLHTLRLITSDSSTPELEISYLPTSLGLADQFREHIEKCRMQKRVREVDIE